MVSMDNGGAVESQSGSREQMARLTLDEAFKRMISKPEVLAPILYEVVDEFKDCSLDEVFDCIKRSQIDGDVEVLNLEDYGSGEESLVTYDSLVTIDLSGVSNQVYTNIIIDTEMQHDKPRYVLENRAQYYVARLLSRQLKSINQTDGYNRLVPVYTIWIVRNPYKEQKNSVRHFVFRDSDGLDMTDCNKNSGVLMHIVMAYLPDFKDKIVNELLKYLVAIFTKNLNASELTRLIQNDKEVEEGVERFMTLEAAVLEEGRREGMEKGMEKGMKKGMVLAYQRLGFSKDRIMEETGLSEENVDKILSSIKSPTIDRG